MYSFRACLGIVALLVGVQGAYAEVRLSNAINESSWSLNASVFSCSLEHSIPYFGEAVFRTRAGEVSGFYLRGRKAQLKAGETRLYAMSPIWAASSEQYELATVSMKQGSRPLWLGNKETEQMMSKLYEGMELGFDGGFWHDESGAPVQLSITNIGFREVYQEYLDCLTGLVPRNFDQLKRTVLKFPAGEVDKLPGDLSRQLDHILALVKHDNKVRVFYIDGHTDSFGDRDENLELSKSRAELVSTYLKRRGVPEEWITVRWHGERYPVSSNANPGGRAKNRRVTVRLERVEEIEVLPLAANS